MKTSAEVCNFFRRRLMRQPLGKRRPASKDETMLGSSTAGELRMPLQMAMEQLLDACCTADPKRTMGLGADNMTLIVVVLLGFWDAWKASTLWSGHVTVMLSHTRRLDVVGKRREKYGKTIFAHGRLGKIMVYMHLREKFTKDPCKAPAYSQLLPSDIGM